MQLRGQPLQLAGRDPVKLRLTGHPSAHPLAADRKLIKAQQLRSGIVSEIATRAVERDGRGPGLRLERTRPDFERGVERLQASRRRETAPHRPRNWRVQYAQPSESRTLCRDVVSSDIVEGYAERSLHTIQPCCVICRERGDARPPAQHRKVGRQCQRLSRAGEAHTPAIHRPGPVSTRILVAQRECAEGDTVEGCQGGRVEDSTDLSDEFRQGRRLPHAGGRPQPGGQAHPAIEAATQPQENTRNRHFAGLDIPLQQRGHRQAGFYLIEPCDPRAFGAAHLNVRQSDAGPPAFVHDHDDIAKLDPRLRQGFGQAFLDPSLQPLRRAQRAAHQSDE